ncbi:cell division protein FtsL [Bartonella sp. B30(2025)]
MTVFRTLDMILVMLMICMAGFTYKVKYDVQKRMSEIHSLEQKILAEKNMVSLLHAEWAVMIEPSRMQKLAKRYHKELELEIIQPRQIVKFEDIPTRVHEEIEEIIQKNTVKESKEFLANNANNHVLRIDDIIQKGVQ